MLRFGWIVVLVLLVALGIVLWVSSSLPKQMQSVSEETSTQPVHQTWAKWTEVKAYPSWRPEITRIETTANDSMELSSGSYSWVEYHLNGDIVDARITKAIVPDTLVIVYNSRKRPWSAEWQITQEPLGKGGSIVREHITETRHTPLYRLFDHFIKKLNL